MEIVTDFIFLGPKITVDSDCSHEIKRLLLLGRKTMTNFSSVQFSSVAQLYPTLCDSTDCCTPGFSVHHQLPELAKTYVHWVGDAVQPSHPLSSPSPPAFNLSQHQGLFQWVSSLHQLAKVLEFQLQPSVLPMNTQDWSPLGWTGWISLQPKGLSRVFSNNTVQEHPSLRCSATLTSIDD